MAEPVGTAERRIRGHLARALTREEIDQLLAELRQETTSCANTPPKGAVMNKQAAAG